jgi:hypothetical protein
MLRRVTLVRTDVSAELGVYIIRVTRIGELMMQAARSSETSVLTRTTRRNIPEDGILQVTTMSGRPSLNPPPAPVKKAAMGFTFKKCPKIDAIQRQEK